MIRLISIKKNDIVHAGVKGMKWGVRKDTDSSSNNSSKKSKGEVDKYDTSRIKGLSDKELADKVKRLNLERQLKSLERAEFKEGVLPGINFAKDVLYASAKQVATQRMTALISKELDNMLPQVAGFAKSVVDPVG